MKARSLLVVCAFLGALTGCDKPHSFSLVRVYVLEDHAIRVEKTRYSSIAEAKAAIKQIESDRPDARFTLSATNVSEQEGMALVGQLSDDDGKMVLVGMLTEPRKN